MLGITRRQHREAVRLREAEETDAIKQAGLSQTSGEWGGTESLGEAGPDNDSPTPTKTGVSETLGLTTTGDAKTSEVEGRAGSGSPGNSQTNSETSKGVTKGSHATVSSGSKGNGEVCKTPPPTNSSSGEACKTPPTEDVVSTRAARRHVRLLPLPSLRK